MPRCCDRQRRCPSDRCYFALTPCAPRASKSWLSLGMKLTRTITSIAQMHLASKLGDPIVTRRATTQSFHKTCNAACLTTRGCQVAVLQRLARQEEADVLPTHTHARAHASAAQHPTSPRTMTVPAPAAATPQPTTINRRSTRVLRRPHELRAPHGLCGPQGLLRFYALRRRCRL